MYLDLIKKEFTLNKTEDNSSLKTKIISFLLKFIGMALFISLEVFIYYSLDNQVSEYSNSSEVNFIFLVLILSITLLISIIFTTLRSRKILFNKEDKRILSTLPISDEIIILSKVSYLFIYQVILNLLITSPILITYFALRGGVPTIYVFSILFSVFISLFGLGISLIFSIVFEFFYRLIKLSDIVQFALAAVIVILLCFAYQVVLNIFLTGLSTNEGSGMLSSSLINNVNNLARFLLPIYTILNPLINHNNIMSGVFITVGLIILSLLVGYIVINLSYNFVHKTNIEFNLNRENNRNLKMHTPFRALINKEFTLLFKDSNNIFSYTALLIMVPFLSFVVITSLNQIVYQNLRIFAVYFPELINGLNILLILLFSSIINASAASSISRENKAIQIVKYLPVDPYKQVIAKLLPPMVLSSISLIITTLVLLITENIDYKVMLTSIFIGVILIIVTSICGLYFDMYDKGNHEHKLSYINTIISIGFPILIFIIHFGLSFLRVNGAGIYSIECILALALLIPLFIKFKDRWIKVFQQMEVN